MGEDTSRLAIAAAAGNNSLYRWIVGIEQKMGLISSKVGSLPSFSDNPSQLSAAVAAPPKALLSVLGIDGKFLITLCNPQSVVPATPTIAALRAKVGINAGFAPILHNVQSAKTLSFDNGSFMVDYGISSQLAYEVQDPNATRFFRMRSSYDGQTWNDWQVFSSPETCGPTGVWSGLLRTPSLALVNSAAQTIDGTNALTQHGTSTQIDVAGKTWNVGSQKITYAGGSTDPGAYGKYYVYAVDMKKAGGVVTYLTTQNQGDLAAQDGIIIFGTITTAAGGGATGGGGGSCHVDGTMIDMYDGSKKNCSDIKRGDVLLGIDGGPEVAQADAEPMQNQPCFTLEFDNGVKVEKGVSSTEPIMLASGIFITVFDAMTTQEFVTKLGNAKLATKTFIGMKLVWRQRLDRTKTFWADGLGSHNMKIA